MTRFDGKASLAVGIGLACAALAGTARAGGDEGKGTSLADEKAAVKTAVLRAEDTLQRLLGELESTLPPPAWSALKAAQERWEQFTASDCAWQRGMFEDGSAAGLVQGQCLEAHVGQRIEDLKLFLCEGYGMTGPCEASEKY
ncbi:MAG: DUF1311 domain-containing protein [Pseudomonadota bacterium]|nr:DUF1311 domain-containing protein [Pseudomonadota bacterium]